MHNIIVGILVKPIEPLKELSHGSPLMHWKIDNDIHNVLCQQLAQRQDYAGPYVVHTYMAQ